MDVFFSNGKEALTVNQRVQDRLRVGSSYSLEGEREVAFVVRTSDSMTEMTRTAMNKRGNATQGRLPIGSPAYGYRVDDHGIPQSLRARGRDCLSLLPRVHPRWGDHFGHHGATGRGQRSSATGRCGVAEDSRLCHPKHRDLNGHVAVWQAPLDQYIKRHEGHQESQVRCCSQRC